MVEIITSRLLTGYKATFKDRVPTEMVPVPRPPESTVNVPEPAVSVEPKVPASLVSAATALHEPEPAVAEPAMANLPFIALQPLNPNAYIPLMPESWKVPESCIRTVPTARVPDPVLSSNSTILPELK